MNFGVNISLVATVHVLSVCLSLTLFSLFLLIIYYQGFGGFSTPSGVINVTVRTRHAIAPYCGVDDSLPVPAIRWLKSGTLVDISLARYRVLDNAQYLVIYNLMDSDIQVSGVPVNYQCQVTNANISFVVTSATVYNLIKTGDCLQ